MIIPYLSFRSLLIPIWDVIGDFAALCVISLTSASYTRGTLTTIAGCSKLTRIGDRGRLTNVAHQGSTDSCGSEQYAC